MKSGGCNERVKKVGLTNDDRKVDPQEGRLHTHRSGSQRVGSRARSRGLDEGIPPEEIQSSCRCRTRPLRAQDRASEERKRGRAMKKVLHFIKIYRSTWLALAMAVALLNLLLAGFAFPRIA